MPYYYIISVCVLYLVSALDGISGTPAVNLLVTGIVVAIQPIHAKISFQ